MPNDYINKVNVNGTEYDVKDSVSGYITSSDIPAQKDIEGGTGLTVVESSEDITINHTNSITAQSTQALYPIAIDAQGHITSYGAAQEIAYKGTMTLSGTTATLSGINIGKVIATIQNANGTGKNVVYVKGSGSGTRELYYLTGAEYDEGFYNLIFSCYDKANNKIKSVYTSSVSTTSTLTSITGTYSEFTIPSKTSDLTNDSGFITLNDIPTIDPVEAGTGIISTVTSESNVISLDTTYALSTGDIITGTSTDPKLVSAKTLSDSFSEVTIIRRWS